MKNKDRRQQFIQNSTLHPSQPDTVTLGDAVEHRFLLLCTDHLRLTGEELDIPPELNTDMLLWRQMRVRHKKGDYRNNRDEKLATIRIAEWTLEVKARLANQKPKKLDWDRS